MIKKVAFGVAAAGLAVAMALTGVAGTGAHAQGKTTATNTSQMCSTNNNTVLTSTTTANGMQLVPTSHGACVSTIQSHGRSSALYASLCQYLVRNNLTVAGAGLAPASWLNSTTALSTTAANLSKILSAAGTSNTNTFSSVGQCVSAFNRAKTSALGTNATQGKHGKHSKHHTKATKGH